MIKYVGECVPEKYKLAVIVIKQYTYVCANGCEEMETIETGNRKLRMEI